MTLSDKAYSTYLLLKRASFLMTDYPNDTSDEDIEKVCKEIVSYLKFN
jgi:hypothetical protein